MNPRTALVALAAILAHETAVAQQVQTICTANPTVCTAFVVRPGDRFDPFVQHLLVRQQLEQLPTDWNITQFFVPYAPNYTDQRALEEMQIRYLEQLNRSRAGRDPDEPDRETPADAD